MTVRHVGSDGILPTTRRRGRECDGGGDGRHHFGCRDESGRRASRPSVQRKVNGGPRPEERVLSRSVARRGSGVDSSRSSSGARKSKWGMFWKGPSHAWDTVLSPWGDLEGPFRGWLQGIDGGPRYLNRGRGVVKRFGRGLFRFFSERGGSLAHRSRSGAARPGWSGGDEWPALPRDSTARLGGGAIARPTRGARARRERGRAPSP